MRQCRLQNIIYVGASQNGLPRTRRSSSDDTPVKAWILGLLAADGSVSKTGQLKLELHQKDLEIVETVRDELAPDARISLYNTRTTPMARFMVANSQLTADLASHGVVNAKSFITTWPSRLPVHLENSFICGVYDGDGSFHREWIYRWSLISANRKFLEAIQEHVLDGTGLRIGGPYKDRNAWTIVATGEPVRALDAWIHKDVPGLTRKRFIRSTA